MVFTYTVRTPGLEGAICYMGLDKHENELLIASGVLSDIWFHVSDLSSAHVYLRLPLRTPRLTINDVGEDTMEDLCQLVKNNSIKGCKMASCKIVLTPWENLRKDLVGMDTGTVGFKNDKLCVYRRCNKDRGAVNRIEKSKVLIKWSYWDIQKDWKERERVLKKEENRAKHEPNGGRLPLPPPGGGGGGIVMVDAIEEADKSDVLRARERAEGKGEGSGLDAALSQLEGINLMAEVERGEEGTRREEEAEWGEWRRDEGERRGLKGLGVWWVERGMERGRAEELGGKGRWEGWRGVGMNGHGGEGGRGMEGEEEVREETEVLKAIYGDEVVFDREEGEGGPVYRLLFEGEEVGEDGRTGCEEMVEMEIWAGGTYPEGRMVWTIKGGGLGARHLRELYGMVGKEEEEGGALESGVCRVFDFAEVVKEKTGLVWEGVEKREKERLRLKREAAKEEMKSLAKEKEIEKGKAAIGIKERLGEFGNTKTGLGEGKGVEKGKGKWTGKSRIEQERDLLYDSFS